MIELEGITMVYNQRMPNAFQALTKVNLRLKDEKMIAIMGTSGAGKSTLLHILALLNRATEGEIRIDGINISNLCEKEICRLRNRKLGLILQDFFLIEESSVIDNVMLPSILAKRKYKDAYRIASEQISKVGLTPLKNKKVYQLSGGEKQRVAISRALVNDPDYILADEPTGSLDHKNSEQVLRILSNISRQDKMVILVTHDIDIAKKCDRIIELRDGEIINDTLISKNE